MPYTSGYSRRSVCGDDGCRLIRIEENVCVSSEPERVWGILADPVTVVACIPGAELHDETDAGSYDGSVVVGFGPMRITFLGTVVIALDHDSMNGVISATARDQQGATRLEAEAQFQVTSAEAGSVVALKGDVDLSGRLATQIEAGAHAVVSRLVRQFTECLSMRLDGGGAAKRSSVVIRIWTWLRKLLTSVRRSTS